MRTPTQKQLLYVLNNKKELMHDEMKDVLWTAYQNNRDYDTRYGPLELEMWNDFLILEKTHKTIINASLTSRVDALEEKVEHLKILLKERIHELSVFKNKVDKY